MRNYKDVFVAVDDKVYNVAMHENVQSPLDYVYQDVLIFEKLNLRDDKKQ